MSKTALITGILGQDGAYLAQYLLRRGYKVYGGFRRTASGGTWRLERLGVEQDVTLVDFDLLELSNILETLEEVRPDEIYNLGAQSFVQASFVQPISTAEITGIGALRLLEAARRVCPGARIYQASSSEMFGLARTSPQNESTPFHPRSPYATAKVFAHYAAVNYREAHGLHVVSGILFNHESPLRGPEFVTRKISLGLAAIRQERRETLELGNLDAKRDWGFAGDYVRGMWLMMHQPEPRDYVLATGESHSVRDFVELAARALDFEIVWEGRDDATTGYDQKTGRAIIRIDDKMKRPAEVPALVGDATRARNELGWTPRVGFSELVEMMTRADLEQLRKGA